MKSKAKRSILFALACCMAFALLAAGCSPKASDEATDGKAKADEPAISYPGMTDYTEGSMGLFPDIANSAEWINAGNRGCNSCHEDLFELTYSMDTGDYKHILVKDTGYKNGSVNECRWCHYSATGATGFVFADVIHNLHYGSEAFVSANTSCWNCHAFTKTTNGLGEYNIGDVTAGDGSASKAGQIEIVLFEDLMYDAALGGYPNNATLAGDQWSLKHRGRDGGYTSGALADADPQFSVEFNQDPTPEENEFIVSNMARVDETDVYATTDWMEDWAIEVKGVKNPRTLTLDDIKAMPQTEITASFWCNVNGYNSSVIKSVPIKGVLLKDFIEAMGGLEEGMNVFSVTCADEWNRMEAGLSVEALIEDGAILAYENWGHDMTPEQGGPLRFVTSGYGGSINVKMITSITFKEAETPGLFGTGMTSLYWVPDINSSWFADDGVQGKVGEAMTISGGVWGFYSKSNAELSGCYPTAVEYSFDYGATWHKVELPANSDPSIATYFDFTWTPQEAGTYVLKMRGIQADGGVQRLESSIIVCVSE